MLRSYWGRMSLFGKISFMAVGMAVVFGLASYYLLAYRGLELMEGELDSSSRDAVQVFAFNLDSFLEERAGELRLLGGFVDFSTACPDQVIGDLEAARGVESPFSILLAYNEDSGLVCTYPDQVFGEKELAALQDYALNTLREGEMQVKVISLVGDDPLVGLSVPVEGPQGEHLGVVQGFFPARGGPLETRLSPFFPAAESAFVLDQEGTLLVHTDRRHGGRNVSSLQVNTGTEELSLGQALRKDDSHLVIEYYWEGQLRRTVLVKSSKADWWVGISRDKQSILAALTALRQEILTTLALVFAYATLGALVITRWLVQPLRQMQQFAQGVAGGSFDAKFPQTVVREIVPVRQALQHMVQRLRDAQLDTIKALVKAIEQKDEYTSGHSERVMELAVETGQALGLPAKDLEVLRYAALLHDVGKIRIPNEVLQYPGRLSEQEWDYIKEHPQASAEIVSQVDFLSYALPGIKSHHERWDGRGYPEGLKGEEIPLVGRIIAVADAFDAMTSDRPYRGALSGHKAFGELLRNRGIQFDPLVVDAFISSIIGREGLKLG